MAISTANAPELTAEQVQHILVKPLEAASVSVSYTHLTLPTIYSV